MFLDTDVYNFKNLRRRTFFLLFEVKIGLYPCKFIFLPNNFMFVRNTPYVDLYIQSYSKFLLFIYLRYVMQSCQLT
jgi:hypothetical protein